ncbi:MAG: iron-sulfur cluster assembly scaffold protein [Nanoarchaeota archaeon]|nr:iron-sulfur cluster assembly scaffold protein [Nanoarchaeota archaeon]MBU1974384.1 iron-sulfur cluster assembly scaffold protein [Nanoarchaeota archaeon]
MYTEETMRHFLNPKYHKDLNKFNAVGEVGNVKCGDVMRIYLDIKDGVIKDISFKTYGCVAAIASTDAMCELVKGMKVEEAYKLTHKDVMRKLGDLPAIKIHCSSLSIEALRKAIENYKKK